MREIRFFDDCLESDSGTETTRIAYGDVLQMLHTEHLLVLLCREKIGVLVARDGFAAGGLDSVQTLIGQRMGEHSGGE